MTIIAKKNIFLDMAGQRYGKWTVIEISGRGNQGGIRWRCKCDCGTEREIYGYSLRRGDSKSCGCNASDRWKERHKEGDRFGRLTCLYPSDQKYKWVVKCDCGNTKAVNMFSMENGHTLSCGCLHSEEVAEGNMRRRKAITGQRFGRLTVLRNAEPDKNGASRYLCKCDCGNEKIVGISHLKRGSTSSCGCMKIKYGVSKKGENARLMRIWDGIKDRCLKEKDPAYSNYGGRGITMCEKWKDDFWAFCNWSRENGYEDDLQIDRIDNDGPYSPDNCRWVAAKENSRNRRNNVNLTVNGKTQCVSAWHEETGIKQSLLYYWASSKGKEYAETRILKHIETGQSGMEV